MIIDSRSRRTRWQGLARTLSTLAACVALASESAPACAEEISKEACVEAHSRGQDAREQGKLSLARKLFMSCAQPACPALVQNDCSRLTEDLERYQPWLSFAARDSAGNDLPDTAVYVDGALVTSRLDDGRAHDVDPGRHLLRFTHRGREQIVNVVVGSGEKGRTVIATFKSSEPAASKALASASEPALEPETKTVHAKGAGALIAAGALLIAGGGALATVGLARIPDDCSLSSHQCAAPPGDSSFEEAGKAVRMSNAGWTVAGIGLTSLTAGLVWFFKSAHSERQPNVSPWVGADSAGVVLQGRM